ncbi:MAG: hypothetical protein A2Z88_04745 [Omnitrophica WOR_2 bacterium GWA2_47_8]|nr:MAG: hypothetical protein A2Z88_04745 [Omnitrophica WOR_2 bacterium GWA2_47_8]
MSLKVNNIVRACLVLAVVSFSSGCVYMVIGGLGVLGGYVVSPDTVEGITDKDADEVWDASIEITSTMGVIEDKQESAGTMATKIQGARVYITIQSIGSSSVKLRVKARKFFFPKISVAQDVYIKIMTELQ